MNRILLRIWKQSTGIGTKLNITIGGITVKTCVWWSSWAAKTEISNFTYRLPNHTNTFWTLQWSIRTHACWTLHVIHVVKFRRRRFGHTVQGYRDPAATGRQCWSWFGVDLCELVSHIAVCLELLRSYRWCSQYRHEIRLLRRLPARHFRLLDGEIRQLLMSTLLRFVNSVSKKI